MLGSCFAGKDHTTLEVYIQETNIRWCAGYTCDTTWLEGTLIDAAIISSMIQIDDYSRDNMIEEFASAIACFSDTFVIGQDYKGNDVPLRDAMSFVTQPPGKGYHAKLVSEDVFMVRDMLQYDADLDEDE